MKALINSYNDIETIEKCIKSLKGFEVHVFDGKYKDFPGTNIHSSDGTRQLAKKLGAIVHPAQPDETQCQKRTRMLSILEDGEYFLRIDADEVLLNPETLPKEFTKDVYWAWEISTLYSEPFMKPRILKKIPGMHNAGKHHYFFDGKNNLITSDQNMGKGYTHEFIETRIYNMRHLRSEKRDVEKTRYYINRDELKYNENSTYKKHQDVLPQPFRAPKHRVQTTVRKKGPADYTLSLLFTRPWAVDRYFANLDKTWLPDKTEIILIADTDDWKLYRKLFSNIMKRKNRFSQIKTYITKDSKAPERSASERRRRIARNMNIMLTEATGNIILGSEDDSLPERPDTYKVLVDDLNRENADFVQGTIVGRWEPIIPAWHVEEKNGELVKIMTGEKKTGLEEIQGCGWYGYAAKADVMRKYQMHIDYCHYVGPDFHFGYDMWKDGKKILHNHDVPFIHFGENFELRLDANTHVRAWQKFSDKWRSLGRIK